MKIFKANKRAVAMVSIALLLVAIVFGVVYAKYVGSLKGRQGVVPKSFVFTSDYLTEGGAKYTIYADSVTFSIQNYNVFDNESADDIEYTISVDNNGSLVSNDSPVLSEVRTLTVDKEKEEFTLLGIAGKSYTVTAESASPYTHTIKATFVFTKSDNTTKIEDREIYGENEQLIGLRVNLYTGSDVNDNTVFTFISAGENEIIPDNTNPFLRNFSTQNMHNGYEVTGLLPDSHYEFIFFFRGQHMDPKAHLTKENGSYKIVIQAFSDT